MAQPIIISTQNYLRSPWKLVPGDSWYDYEDDQFEQFTSKREADLFGVTRAEQEVRAIDGELITIPVDLHWTVSGDYGADYGVDIVKTDYLGPPNVFILDEDEVQMYQTGDYEVLDHRSIQEWNAESILRDEIEEHFTRREILDAADAQTIVRMILEKDEPNDYFTEASFTSTAQLERGNIVTDVEGLDLGPEGAVVTRVDDDKVELARLDNGELVQVDLSKADYHAHEAPELTDLGNSQYDEEAMNSPEIHNIRSLPTYWGPRDPNNPSTLTDVSWRPEPFWRRRQHRYYSTETPMRDRRRRHRRRAEPLPTIDPLPHAEDPPERLQTDYGLPRRMQLQNWVEQDDQEIDTETLIDLVINFWKGYRRKRTEHLPQSGSHKSLDLVDWILIFEKRHDMERDEVLLLLDFMVATDLIPSAERERFVDMLDAYVVHRYDQL